MKSFYIFGIVNDNQTLISKRRFGEDLQMHLHFTVSSKKTANFQYRQ